MLEPQYIQVQNFIAKVIETGPIILYTTGKYRTFYLPHLKKSYFVTNIFFSSHLDLHQPHWIVKMSPYIIIVTASDWVRVLRRNPLFVRVAGLSPSLSSFQAPSHDDALAFD